MMPKANLPAALTAHDSLGQGKIGNAPFEFIMKDNRFDGIPLVLETVNPDIWAQEIAWLKSLAK